MRSADSRCSLCGNSNPAFEAQANKLTIRRRQQVQLGGTAAAPPTSWCPREWKNVHVPRWTDSISARRGPARDDTIYCANAFLWRLVTNLLWRSRHSSGSLRTSHSSFATVLYRNLFNRPRCSHQIFDIHCSQSDRATTLFIR